VTNILWNALLRLCIGLGFTAYSSAQSVDLEPLVPHGRMPGELIPWARVPTAAPQGEIRTPAEYEPNAGLLLRWGQANSTVTELVSKASNADSSMLYWVVVANASAQTQANSALQTAGSNMDRVRFITASTNSVWMRDYGPRYVYVNEQRAIVDHTYNRSRPLDDAFPQALAGLWNEPYYLMPIVHGGGNFHLFADGQAFMTRLIQNENTALTVQAIRQQYRDYQNLDLRITDALPVTFDSTQHIDMWMLPVADRRVILNSYPIAGANYSVPRQVTEANASLLQSEGYEVLRTPAWQASGTHYTYANAVILNRSVLLCQFDGYPQENAQAVAVFSQAFAPTGRTITTMNCSSIITASGAIHCIVMHVPEATAAIVRTGFE
jgi:agmatine deiminase